MGKDEGDTFDKMLLVFKTVPTLSVITKYTSGPVLKSHVQLHEEFVNGKPVIFTDVIFTVVGVVGVGLLLFLQFVNSRLLHSIATAIVNRFIFSLLFGCLRPFWQLV